IMTLLSTINANGTTVLMATHDSGIVDTMKRRVIELIAGQIVRDERQGGYQTQAVPVQGFGLGERAAAAPDATPASPASAPVVPASAPAPAAHTASFYVPKQRPASEPPADAPSASGRPAA